MLYNHGEQSVITPPPVPISSRSFSVRLLLLLSSASPSLHPPAPPFVLLFSLSLSSFYSRLSPVPHCSLRPSPCLSSLIGRTRPVPPTSFLHHGPPRWPRRRAAVTRITRIVSKTANNKCFSAPRNIVKFLPTLPILPWVRVVFSDSRKLNVRGNWRVIRVSQLRRLAAL